MADAGLELRASGLTNSNATGARLRGRRGWWRGRARSRGRRNTPRRRYRGSGVEPTGGTRSQHGAESGAGGLGSRCGRLVLGTGRSARRWRDGMEYLARVKSDPAAAGDHVVPLVQHRHCGRDIARRWTADQSVQASAGRSKERKPGSGSPRRLQAVSFDAAERPVQARCASRGTAGALAGQPSLSIVGQR